MWSASEIGQESVRAAGDAAAPFHECSEYEQLVRRRTDTQHNRQERQSGSARTIDRWFDTSQFSQPAPFTFGNMARSTAQLRNANARLLDFSLFKSFRIMERMRAELRGEAFNLTNTPLFGNPGTTLNTPTFGVVTSQENSPRQVQIGLKILF